MGTTPFRYRHPSIQPPNSNSLSEGKQGEGERGGTQEEGTRKTVPNPPIQNQLTPYKCRETHTDTDTQYTYLVTTLPYTPENYRSQLNETVTISPKAGKTVFPSNSGCTLHHRNITSPRGNGKGRGKKEEYKEKG
ncbi:unnamed protein product [Cercopithifilaria johnstoni]|uniref:Uncharacterized protein n=1 Tax=Cercopithifilaria johnstoni TaxID=2874296 RepID=A0A8J2PY47_9BILA|nr:unnamed protein product [Cercopithifilaria johnstoni]